MSYLFSFLLLLWCLVFPSFLVKADERPVINEFLAHPSTGEKEWVELYVPDGVDATNYWIDDDIDFAGDTGNSAKKQITTAIQGSDSRHVIFESTSSMFNNSGDIVALFTPDGTLVDQYQYTSDPGADISIGRTPDGTGNFQVLSSATRGSPNSNPRPPDTSTPEPTEKPAPTPKPTVTPKPTHSTSSGQVATPKIEKSATTMSKTFADASKSIDTSLEGAEISTSDAQPTSVLAASTKSAQKKFVKPLHKILIKGTSSNRFQVIAISIGGLLLLGCGIVIYLKKLGYWPWNKEYDHNKFSRNPESRF